MTDQSRGVARFSGTLAAGASRAIGAHGEFFYFQTMTTDASLLVTAGSVRNRFEHGEGMNLPTGATFDRLTLENDGNAAVDYVVMVGFGAFIDRRSTVGGVVSVREQVLGSPMWGFQTCSAVAAQYGHVQLLNPDSSGVTVYLDAIFAEIRSNGAGLWLCEYGTALSSADGYEFPKDVDGSAAAAEIRFQKTGSLLGSTRAFFGGQATWERFRWDIKDPFVLGQGQGLLLRGDTVNADVYAGFEWREVPV